MGSFEPLERLAQLLVRRHGGPVARPQVGSKYHDSPRGEAVKQARRSVGGAFGLKSDCSGDCPTVLLGGVKNIPTPKFR